MKTRRIAIPALLATLSLAPTNGRCGSGPFAPQPSADFRPVVPVASQPYTWSSVKIVDGGDMPSIVMHPSERGLMYIRANIGGAYRWNSSTELWAPVTDWISGPDWSLSGVESIALDPTDANRVYLAAGMYLHWSPISAAILISGNRGKTFQRVNLPFMMGGNDTGQQTGERLVVNPFNPAQLYLATHLNGLWQSLDYGASWGQAATFPILSSTDEVGLSFVRFDPREDGTVYVGAYSGGIYRSTDGGATWVHLPGQPTLLPDGETLRPMRSALGADGVFYVSYANAAPLSAITNGAVYKFNPGDGTWSNITPRDTQGISGYGFVGLAADPQRAGTVMVATWDRWSPTDTIFRSTDGGKTWLSLAGNSVRDGSLSPYIEAVGNPFGNWISSIEIDPFDSNHALYTNGYTVWASNDLTNADSGNTVHWAVGADGIEETAVLTLASPPAGAHLLSGMGDVCGYRHDDFGVSPPPFLNPWMQTVWSLDFAESNPTFVARVGLLDYNGNAAGAYSSDQGATWTQFAGNPAGASGIPGNPYSSMIAVSADGKTLVWAPNGAGPSYSRDAGATWTLSTGGVSNLFIASDRVNASKFYGFDGATGTVYVSADGGATFAASATALPPDAGSTVTNEARPRTVAGREGDLWLPLAGGLYHSTDSGASFARLGTVGSSYLVGFGSAAPNAAYPAVYLVGTVGGVYGIFRSNDAGVTWTRINDNNHQFGMLSVITGDPRIYGRVYLGTSGRGILHGDPVQRNPRPLM
jgi:photosystem II stability/assembly factor-like uncharacterized protein